MTDHCLKCGKPLIYTSAMGVPTLYAGLLLDLPSSEGDPNLKRFLAAQMGKYANTQHAAVCYECLLDSVLGKEVVREEEPERPSRSVSILIA